MVIINIAADYSKTPGGRLIAEGPYSGEEFREKHLSPKFEEAIRTGEKLTVNLDGGFGYATSFLEEAFGGLARITKNRRLLEIEIISEEEPALIDKIRAYISDALK